MMASMRDWLKGPDAPKNRVVVVHCKAGKGRSGTVACSYLISEEGWTKDEALSRFTLRRMRSGFGDGVSIPSQLRWVGYVDRWTKHNKIYVDRRVEVLEVHVWGLREGVKVGVNGYVDDGRTIKSFHIFKRKERILVDSISQTDGSSTSLLVSKEEMKLPVQDTAPKPNTEVQATPTESLPKRSPSPAASHTGSESGGSAVILRPSSRIILPSNDIDIEFERRNKAAYGWTMVTSVAHVWFNTFFEGRGPENHGDAITSGVFEIEWDAMDGIRGSPRKGIRALDRLAVVWRALVDDDGPGRGSTRVIMEPQAGEPVPETHAADWKGEHHDGIGAALGKHLGLRTASPASANISKASSLASIRSVKMEDDPALGVRSHGPNGEEQISPVTDGLPTASISEPSPQDASNTKADIPDVQSPLQTAQDDAIIGDSGLSPTSGITENLKKLNTEDFSDETSKKEVQDPKKGSGV